MYFLMFVFTEYLLTRDIVNMEFATGVTVMLNFIFVWVSVMMLLMQGIIETARRH
jgi:hypothetical protein